MTLYFKTDRTGDAIYAISDGLTVWHIGAMQGAVAGLMYPGWANAAPTISVAEDVAVWLAGMQS